MLINSIQFILFIIILLLIYKIMPKKYKWTVLLIASYIFYFLNSSKLIAFILVSTISIYFVAIKMQKIDEKAKIQAKNIEDKEEKKKLKNKAKKKKKIVLAVGIIFNLAILVFLKYSGFIAGSLNTILHINLPIFKFILPLGISYYTLQAISYIVDVYRGKVEADKNIARVALFVAYFPQLVQGPIGRYDELANQLYNPHEITFKNLTYGSELMLWGYFKKMVIADRVAMYVNGVFADYANYSGPIIIMAIIGYTLQIYAEFSGGIDIVRGASQMFGIELVENFKRPFYSKSVDEFWRRWNITLGTWLKDYVFYPVSLSKVTLKLTNFSRKIFKTSYFAKIVPISLPLLCVWLGNGFWHGSGLKYIVYGLYYYAIMMLGKIFEPVGKKIISLLKINVEAWSYKLWQMLRTCGFVCIGMLIFRAENLNAAIQMFKSIFNVHNLERIFNGEAFLIGGMTIADIVVLIIATVIFIGISIAKEHGKNIRESFAKQNLAFRWVILYGLIFAIIVFGAYGQGYNPQSFIYGQF
ncbi:MAG: MBOAT family protein [Clostridia bacterium]|nr:MBOAT family protein [Clostridia bacterium]